MYRVPVPLHTYIIPSSSFKASLDSNFGVILEAASPNFEKKKPGAKETFTVPDSFTPTLGNIDVTNDHPSGQTCCPSPFSPRFAPLRSLHSASKLLPEGSRLGFQDWSHQHCLPGTVKRDQNLRYYILIWYDTHRRMATVCWYMVLGVSTSSNKCTLRLGSFLAYCIWNCSCRAPPLLSHLPVLVQSAPRPLGRHALRGPYSRWNEAKTYRSGTWKVHHPIVNTSENRCIHIWIYNIYIYTYYVQEYPYPKVPVPQLSCLIWLHLTTPWNIYVSLKNTQTWALVIHIRKSMHLSNMLHDFAIHAKACGRYGWEAKNHGMIMRNRANMAHSSWHAGPYIRAFCGQTATCLWIAHHVSLMLIKT